jgi:hypothetical protein
MLRIPAVLLVAATMGVMGCSTGAKEAIGFVRGAKGIYAPVQPVAPATTDTPLAQYRNFELGTFTDSFGGKVPPGLDSALRTAFQRMIDESDLPDDPSGPTLVITGEYLHYESADTLGVAIGPLEEVVARCRMVDQSSGRVLGTANCVGRTTNRVNIGVQKKAEGLAKSIISWIRSVYPDTE